MIGSIRTGHLARATLACLLPLAYTVSALGQPAAMQVPTALAAAPIPAPPPPADDDLYVSDSNAGYLDNARPGSQVVVRYDAGFGFDFPNRAEFVYAKGGAFGSGTPLAESSVNFQHLSAYVEAAWVKRFSTFLEVPVRFIDPVINADEAGLSDVNAGFKWAFWDVEGATASFQLRTYAPSGDARKGLGTNHVSIEPALLSYVSLTDRLALLGELRYWFPIGGSDFAGDLFRYGAGVRYNLVETCSYRLTPIVELVGWTVLSGKESRVVAPGVVFLDTARGTNILNAKVGMRLDFSPDLGLYAGYGRALTGERWYEDVVRVEFRLGF